MLTEESCFTCGGMSSLKNRKEDKGGNQGDT